MPGPLWVLLSTQQSVDGAAAATRLHMQPPARLLVGAGCLVVGVVANKLRQRNQSSNHYSRPQNEAVMRDVREVVHAYASMSPTVSVSQQVVRQQGMEVPWGLLVLCTGLICSAIAAAVLREQWDIAIGVAVAWGLVLLNQVGFATGSSCSC